MKAKLAWLQGSITGEQYCAVEIEVQPGDGYRHLWRIPCSLYETNPERAQQEAQAIVDAINGETAKDSIDHLELSIRSYNGLHDAHIHSLGELMQMSESQLLRVKGLGRRCVREIKETLAAKGLMLRQHPAPLGKGGTKP